MEDASQLSPLLRINDDVLHEICAAVLGPKCLRSRRRPHRCHADADWESFKALAACCKQLRNALAPRLMKSIRLHVKLDPDWSETSSMIEALSLCTLVQQFTKRCHIELWSGGGESDPPTRYSRRRGPGKMERFLVKLGKSRARKERLEPEHRPPPPGLALRLAECLASMRVLESMAIMFPLSDINTLKDAFDEANLVLPSVKTLTLGPCSEWLIAFCPNVSTIRTDIQLNWNHVVSDGQIACARDLINAAASHAPELQRFELYGPCVPQTLQALARTMPKIPELVLSCSSSSCFPISDPSLDHDDPRVRSALGKFTSLRMLAVPGIAKTPEWPWCGNAFDGPGGQEYRAQLVEQTERAERAAADAVVAACGSSLESLWTGNRRRWLVSRIGEDQAEVNPANDSREFEAGEWF